MKTGFATLALALGTAAAASSPASVLATSPTGMSDTGVALRCAGAASPLDRYFECNSLSFERLDKTLLGDWNGARRELAAIGLTPTLAYTGAYFVNTSNPPREGSYGGGFSGSLNWDFGKLGAPGWSAYLGLWWMQATGINALVNTASFPANDDFVGSGFWVGQFYLQKTAFNGDLTVAAGRLGPGVTFATLPVFGAYSNAAINANPGSLGINEPPFAPPPPGSQWGVQALYNFTPVVQGALGVFNNNPESAAGERRGLAWRWRAGNTGLFTMAQLNWLYNQGPKDTGMPGQYTLGGFWDGNQFPTISGTPATAKDNWGVYLMGQQQITQPNGSGSSQGWTVWAAGTYSGKQAINPMPTFLAAGASLTGPFKSRPNDIASAGWYYGRLSNENNPPTQNTQAVELFYQYTVDSTLNLVASAQYFFRPLGYSAPGTMVLGAQFELTF